MHNLIIGFLKWGEGSDMMLCCINLQDASSFAIDVESVVHPCILNVV